MFFHRPKIILYVMNFTYNVIEDLLHITDKNINVNIDILTWYVPAMCVIDILENLFVPVLTLKAQKRPFFNP